MKTKRLIVGSSSGKYPILIGFNLISKIPQIFKQNRINFTKCLLFVDEKVPKKFLKKIRKSLKGKENYTIIYKSNEINKSQKTINKILDFLLKKNFSRKDYLISIGGGITGDVGGFAASLLKRGIKFINIPTTLLAQVDSSIGGKTGINSKYGKNMIGSFYQPKLVISDMNFLASLPKKEIICGYGEILKHSLIANKNFYKFLNKNFNQIINLKSPFIEKAIFESCKIKKNFVENDEKEQGQRKTLNFGHTFAHAFEATLNYSKKLNHGEAVILGIQIALNFSLQNKFLNEKNFYEIAAHLKNPLLPSDIKKYFSQKDLEKIVYFMTKDKKNDTDKIQIMLLKKIGSPIINKEFKKDKLKTFLKKELTY